MGSKKRWMALLLMFVLVVSLAGGCSSKGKGSQDTAKETQTKSSQDEGSGEDTVEAQNSLPLTKEPVTLTVFAGLDNNLTGIINDYNENEFFKELEKRTGVHLEFTIPASGNEKEAYNLMIASDNLADIITHNGYDYPEGLDAAVDDGYYLDLTPYLDTYLKDYNKLRKSDPLIEKSTMTDTGRVIGFHIVYTEKQGPWMGMQVRKDWLDELGLGIPVTYDDWEEALTQFKEKKNAYAPLAIGANGYMETSHALSAGYGVFEDFMQVDGKVVYGPIQDGWRDYLSMLNRWYEKGLIDPDFMTNGTWQVDTGMVVNGDTGAWNAMYTMISQYEAAVPEMEVVPVTSPVKKAGDKLHIRREDGYVGNAVTISANCEHPDIAMKLMDYLYTDKGALLANYGVENDTFQYNGDKPVVTDKISKNDKYSMSQAQALYLMPPSRFGGLYDWTRELAAVPEKDVKAFDIWGVADDSYIIPSRISYTSDESSERANIMAEISTYMQENTDKFITGVLDINKDWDNYVATIKGMSIDRATEITQDALARFNAR